MRYLKKESYTKETKQIEKINQKKKKGDVQKENFKRNVICILKDSFLHSLKQEQGFFLMLEIKL